MNPSIDSLRLRALALELLPQLSKSGDCVAVTGAAARGNATPNSELELWVLGARNGRVVKKMNGVQVTLHCQRPDDAREFENLCEFEVDDVLLLDDRAGHFEALRTVWKKVRRRVRAENIRSTQRQIELELSRGAHGSDWHRTTFLRLAAWRLLCLRVYIDHGWRVARLDSLRTALPKPLAKRLDEILALPKVNVSRKAVKLMPAALREAQRHVPKRKFFLESTLEHDEREAAFLARLELISELLPCVFNTWGITDVRGIELLGKQAPNTVKAFQWLEPSPGKGAVKKLEAHVKAIRLAIAST